MTVAPTKNKQKHVPRRPSGVGVRRVKGMRTSRPSVTGCVVKVFVGFLGHQLNDQFAILMETRFVTCHIPILLTSFTGFSWFLMR